MPTGSGGGLEGAVRNRILANSQFATWLDGGRVYAYKAKKNAALPFVVIVVLDADSNQQSDRVDLQDTRVQVNWVGENNDDARFQARLMNQWLTSQPIRYERQCITLILRSQVPTPESERSEAGRDVYRRSFRYEVVVPEPMIPHQEY